MELGRGDCLFIWSVQEIIFDPSQNLKGEKYSVAFEVGGPLCACAIKRSPTHTRGRLKSDAHASSVAWGDAPSNGVR